MNLRIAVYGRWACLATLSLAWGRGGENPAPIRPAVVPDGRVLKVAAELAGSGEPEAAPRALLVKFRSGTRDMEASLSAAAESCHAYADANRTCEGQPGPEFFDTLVRVKLREGASLEETLKEVRARPDVEYAEADAVVQLDIDPNDPRYPELWGMARIQAPQAWDLQTGRSQVVVAVIDTGIDYTHPDLADNLWANAGEIPGNNIDDDGNGYVDDLFGYDFANQDADPMDDHFHGTHVAGTVGAIGNNGVGVVGVAWRVRLMALKFLDADGSGTIGGAISAIQYAVNNGAHILSNSWSGTVYFQTLQDAITAANNSGRLVVASAGNSGNNTPRYPAAMEGVVAVSATDSSDQTASFSTFGSFIDLAAPGVNILSTAPNGQYRLASGTSMACPHVSGLAALLKSRNFGLTKDQILSTMQSAADDLGAPGWDPFFGHGRINAFRALSSVPPDSSGPAPTLAISSPGQSFCAYMPVVGTAAGSTFAGHQLHAARQGGSGWQLIGSGVTPVSNEALGTLHPSGWSPGPVWIRLTVVDTAGASFRLYRQVRLYPLGAVNDDLSADIPVLRGGNGRAQVRVYSGAANGVALSVFDAYPGFGGPVYTALGDVTGDGRADIVTGAGEGGSPHVMVFDGVTRAVIHSFLAYGSFTGGVRVAAGDVNGDGKADILTVPGPGGGPHVQVFDGQTLGLLHSFFAYDSSFTGGVWIAAGDVDGDGKADIVTAPDAGGGPHVWVRRSYDLATLHSFFAYDPALRTGVRVAAGDVDGDGKADIITAPGAGAGPHVWVRRSYDLATLHSFFAYDPAYAGGVRVAAGDVNGDGKADIVTQSAEAIPHVRAFHGVTQEGLLSFFAY